MGSWPDVATVFLPQDSVNHAVRRVWPDQSISRMAGNFSAGNAGDGGAATAAMLSNPQGVDVSSDAVTGGGSVFVAGAARALIVQ